MSVRMWNRIVLLCAADRNVKFYRDFGKLLLSITAEHKLII